MTTITTKRPYKSNRRGSGTKNSVGEKGFVMLGGSPRLVNHRHSAEQQTGFTPYDTYRSGSDESDGDGYYYEDGSRGSVGSANSGMGSGVGMGSGGGARTSHVQAGDEDDYGYAFDPEGDGESARQHAQQQAALHTYHKYEEHMRQQSSVGSGVGGGNAGGSGVGGGSNGSSGGSNGTSGGSSGRGLYSSLGRRVMSAPNLTELNLSSWKDTDYRPLPVDSLKEMFSQPIGHNNNNHNNNSVYENKHMYSNSANNGNSNNMYAHGVYNSNMYDNNTSLLPEHVYSAMGTDSGRYTNRGSGRGSAAVMAARARATKLALLQHQSLTHNNTHTNTHTNNTHYTQYNTPNTHYTQYTYKDDSGVNMNSSDMYHSSNGIGYGGSEGGGYSGGGSGMGGVGKARMKRSHSAMALMDFERLAGDDTAAGDFFLQFLNKVSDTSNNNTPRREPSTHAYTTNTTHSAHTHTTHSAAGVAELILEEDSFCTGTSTAKLPGIPDTLMPVAADIILPLPTQHTVQHTLQQTLVPLQQTLVPQVHTVSEQVDHVYVPSTHISSVSSVVNSVTSSSGGGTSSSGVVNSTSGGTSGGSEVVPAYEQEVESTMDLS